MNVSTILNAYDQLYAIRSELDADTWHALIAHVDGLGVTEVTAIAPVRVEKAAKASTPKPAAEKATSPTPIADGKFLCEVCGARFGGPAPFGMHMKAEHWTDIVEEWELNGAPGLQREFGISSSTAAAWSKKIEKAAA